MHFRIEVELTNPDAEPMIPFIIRFAHLVRGTAIAVLPSTEYDPDTEMTILQGARAKKLAVDEEHVGFATGTLRTEASSDPTSDEPTDR